MKSGSGDKREMEYFFFVFLSSFLSSNSLDSRFSKGILNVNFFSSVFFVGYFFRVFVVVTAVVVVVVVIVVGQVYVWVMIVSIQRFANVCPCLIEFRGYIRLCVYSILFSLFFSILLFFFSPRFAGLIAIDSVE